MIPWPAGLTLPPGPSARSVWAEPARQEEGRPRHSPSGSSLARADKYVRLETYLVFSPLVVDVQAVFSPILGQIACLSGRRGVNVRKNLWRLFLSRIIRIISGAYVHSELPRLRRTEGAPRSLAASLPSVCGPRRRGPQNLREVGHPSDHPNLQANQLLHRNRL
jgi:hypothetical protein